MVSSDQIAFSDSESDSVSRVSPRPSWILERDDFCNSESACHPNASHQGSAQSDLRFGRRSGLKNFKTVALDIETER